MSLFSFANIHQLAQFWLTPPINFWIFILLGLIFWRTWQVVLSCLCCGLIITYIQCTPLFAEILTSSIYPKLNTPYNRLQVKPQAIVVLGAGVTSCIDYIGKVGACVDGASLLNVHAAARVALENPNLPLILSGGITDGVNSEADGMNNYLKDNYSLANISILESQSLNTNENARYTALKLQELGIYRIILVTQASHMWRSLALFNKYGISAVGYPAWDDYLINSLIWWQKLLPTNTALEQTTKILHEMIGYFVYVIL